MKYRLSNAVFYRKYNDHVLLFHTGNKRVLILNTISKDILDCFQEWITPEECLSLLRQNYDIPEDQEEMVAGFIEEMLSKEILVEENILSERKDSAELWFQNELLPENQLYSVQFELTFRCNEKCRHCYCVTDDRKELSTEEIKRILDELYEMNVFEVTFTGGDLFVRQDAFEILRYARSKAFLVTIFTNGIALSDSDSVSE